VARITALGPDVVLVHRSVARLAQDRLRECGVTLVLNVKLSVLKRVARCTGASIVNTIDAHISARYMLGTCKKFYLRNFPDERSKCNHIYMNKNKFHNFNSLSFYLSLRRCQDIDVF